MAYGSVKVDSIVSSTQTVSVDDLLVSGDIGTTVQAYDATILNDADIGVTVQAYDADTAKLDAVQTFTAAQTFNAGASDAGGSFRTIPPNSKTAAYTLLATDTGKYISITTGGVTVPASVFSAGDVVSIYNNSASDQTITQGASVTLRLVADGTAGNKTLAGYGLATVLCVGTDEFVIAGAGVS